MQENDVNLSEVGRVLIKNRWFQIREIFGVFAVAAVVIFVGFRTVGENLFAKQMVIFAANVAMLMMVWLGLRFRKQGWDHFGLSFEFPGWKDSFSIFLKSLAVFILAIAGFVFGSIIMANIVGIPEQADLNSYNYLKGNLP